MKTIGSFKVKNLSYGVTELSGGRYKIQVPSIGTQRSAFHIAPEVFATFSDNVVVLTGLPAIHKEHEEEMKNGIKTLLRQ